MNIDKPASQRPTAFIERQLFRLSKSGELITYSVPSPLITPDIHNKGPFTVINFAPETAMPCRSVLKC
jgi:hypothetical protein